MLGMFVLLPVCFRGAVEAGHVFPGGLEFSVSNTCSESHQLQIKYSVLLCICSQSGKVETDFHKEMPIY